MKQKRRYLSIKCLIALLVLWFSAAPGRATEVSAEPGDSLRISLLTCAVGDEIYSLFGHTAIRCENLTRGTDVVYNYGIFDFSSGGFVLRFALGETDYRLDREPTDYFNYAYYYHGRDVWKQTLNLTQEEKLRLIGLLEENFRPENRVYRYNFFYDNCSTRPRDKVEEAVQGSVDYGADMDAATDTTFRDLIDQYSQGHPWSRLAMNLCLGSEADKPINRRTQMFVPFCLKDYFSHAQITDSVGHTRPLVANEGLMLKALEKSPAHDSLPSPELWAWLVFGMTALLTYYGLRRRKSFWVFDAVLFTTAGLAGCILAFLVFLSQHPCMSPNYLLFVFHPLHLLCLPWVIYDERKQRRNLYLGANVLVLTLFMAFWALIPQEFPLTVVPLALSLYIRSIGNLLLAKRKQQ